MAGQNRRDIFDPNEVGCFHAVQRTVRRAWLYAIPDVAAFSFCKGVYKMRKAVRI
jgi:hypothetical protein